MRTVDVHVNHALSIISKLLLFFEARLSETRPLISKDIAFFVFSRYEKLSKLQHDFRKLQSNADYVFPSSAALTAIRTSFEQSYLDMQLIDDLITTIDNSWCFLENTFCSEIDVLDVKKEISLKLKCQGYSDFSQDREDVAVLALLLLEEFARYTDQIISCLQVTFINDKTTKELLSAENFPVCKGFRRFFELEKGHSSLTDFYQRLVRYICSISDSLENNIFEMKAFRAKSAIPEKDKSPILISSKHQVYKEFVQKKITGLIGLMQHKNNTLSGLDGFDNLTNDFLSNIVNEVSMQQFEEHLKEMGSLGKV